VRTCTNLIVSRLETVTRKRNSWNSVAAFAAFLQLLLNENRFSVVHDKCGRLAPLSEPTVPNTRVQAAAAACVGGGGAMGGARLEKQDSCKK
jgi:hypothetical protein